MVMSFDEDRGEDDAKRAAARELLGYVGTWRLSKPAWDEIVELLRAAKTAADRGDAIGFATAIEDLEAMGPLKATPIETAAALAPAPEEVRERLAELLPLPAKDKGRRADAAESEGRDAADRV